MKFFFVFGALLFTAAIITAESITTEAPAPGGAIASLTTNAPPADAPRKITLKVVKTDSEETAGENGKAANAVDGNPKTIWHTQWQDDSPACPHEIIIELSEPAAVMGFSYLPRQDESDHGCIKEYEFYVSDDGKDFGKPVKQGEFNADREKKTVMFDGKKCRFIKLRAVSEINDEPWTSAAEINIVLAD